MIKETHFIINCTEGIGVVIPSFPCTVCGKTVRTKQSANKVLQRPVLHSLQMGVCSSCQVQHVVFSASTSEHCQALEPYLQAFINSKMNEPYLDN